MTSQPHSAVCFLTPVRLRCQAHHIRESPAKPYPEALGHPNTNSVSQFLEPNTDFVMVNRIAAFNPSADEVNNGVGRFNGAHRNVNRLRVDNIVGGRFEKHEASPFDISPRVGIVDGYERHRPSSAR